MSSGFLSNSILLGAGLGMDAFSVSVADSISFPDMKRSKRFLIPGVFAVFQFLMPLAGYIIVSTIQEFFGVIQNSIPWIAMILLGFIGIRMIIEGIRGSSPQEGPSSLSFPVLLMQGVATSIDALSAGLAMSDYSLSSAFLASSIIAVVTFILCITGIFIGRKLGMKLAGRAPVLGGAILIAIGLRIFIGALI